jgi:primosomal protein N' (replication factor Y)
VLFAEVAVNTDAPYRHPFTYSIPTGLQLNPGQGVLVPFGQRVLQGVVVSVGPSPSFEGEIRPVLQGAAELPAIPPHLVDLASWIARRYFAPIFSCVALLLPPGVERRTRTLLIPTESGRKLTDGQQAIIEALLQSPNADLTALQRSTGIPRLAATVEAMVRGGMLRREYRLEPPTTSPRIVRCLRLTTSADQVEVAGPLFQAIRAAGGTLPLASLRHLAGWSDASARRLIDDGLAEEVEARIYRDPLAGEDYPLRPAPRLSPAQAEAVERILNPSAPRPPLLLHGVTGSGKTEVYLAAAAETIAAGRQVLVLVPEISLTPQTVERFAGRFPGRVAVLHSGLSDGQRYDQWSGIQSGHFDIVVGSRSGIFAPMAHLGLIVIDEEHEWTYKQQDPQPRYQTRDVAVCLASLTGAPLVLGSATPDVTSYYRAIRGTYELLRLPDRVRPAGDAVSEAPGALPDVEVVDLAAELQAGNRSIFSRSLSAALAQTLNRGDQALLFLNRRGSASFMLCRDCGHVPRCSRCAVSLTYHADGERLVCHLCGLRRRSPDICPRCHSRRIRKLGLGTQRVVDEVERRFPQARVIRWDRDSARGAADHAALFGALERGDADVVVGTQMVAKGLDLPKLTLVGIVNADLSLNLPDYYSAERAFQLLTQVAGRAGRRDRPGRVVLQTYAPNHYAVLAAAKHDYASFYAGEIDYRRRGAYPPFSRLTRLVYTSGGLQHAQREAERLAAEIRRLIVEGQVVETLVSGPAPCRTARLRGRWRWQILIRSPRPTELLERLQFPRGWSIDVDPESFV